MVEQRSPGWYDDGRGEIRWWSGRGWTLHTQRHAHQDDIVPAVPEAPFATPDTGRSIDEAAPVTHRRGYRGRTVLLSAGAAALLGMFLGIGAGGANAEDAAAAVDVKAAPAYVALQTRLTSTLTERDALKAAAADTTSRAADTADRQAALDTTGEALDSREAALDEREVKLDKRAKKIARAASAAVASTSRQTSTPTSKPVVKAPVSVYFQNCDAARAAGAAPVRRGDPGYASHLDRDGDGVGCE